MPAFFVFTNGRASGERYEGMQIVIFTDLDGTLLHPRTYSFEEAKPALDMLRSRSIPLVLCSSKTRAEIEVYRKRLNNGHPFVSENGGAVFVPAAYFSFALEGEPRNDYTMISVGSSYREIREHFVSLRGRLKARVRGFGDMSVEEIVGATGLHRDEAALAKEREFDEPFVFQGEPDGGFLREIEEEGLRWTRGRFYHIMGESDKGNAVRMLKTWYEREHGKIVSIGLGDGMNDLPLLNAVDHPVLVRKEDGSYEEEISMTNLIKADGIGPKGWNRAIMGLLAE